MAKENTTRLIVYIIGGVLIILAWGIAFGAIKSDVKHAVEDVKINTSEIKAIEIQQGIHNERLVRIDTRQEVVIKGIEEIKAEIKKK